MVFYLNGCVIIINILLFCCDVGVGVVMIGIGIFCIFGVCIGSICIFLEGIIKGVFFVI